MNDTADHTIWLLFPRTFKKGRRKVLGRYRPRSAWDKEALLFKPVKAKFLIAHIVRSKCNSRL